jgi:hypothetical protein
VARLGPLPEGTPLELLRAAGEFDSATGDVDDLPEPVVLAAGVESPSQALVRLRRHEG